MFEGVLTEMAIESYIFWDVMSCSTLKVNRRFGGICCLHLQNGRKKQEKTGRKRNLRHASLILGLFFDPEDEGKIFPKCQLTLNGLHGVISQKI
jgi:hypothetical protein